MSWLPTQALHRSLRKIIKTRGSFPNDDAALKLLYLAIKNAGLRWRRGMEWTAAMGQFATGKSVRREPAAILSGSTLIVSEVARRTADRALVACRIVGEC